VNQSQLSIEIRSGPLDGQIVTIEAEAEWSRAGNGILSFPWDETLGTPQARFVFVEGAWWLEPLPNPRSTRRNGEQIRQKIALSEGDWLKAASTLLFIKEVTQV